MAAVGATWPFATDWRRSAIHTGCSHSLGYAIIKCQHPLLVSDRILRYAAIVGRENVIAETDCGLGGRVHADLAWAAGDVAYNLPSRSWIRPARIWRCTAMPTWFGRSLGHAR